MYVVDRIVDDKMYCESLEDDFEKITVDRIIDVKEGDVIKKVGNEYIIDFEITEKRKNNIKTKLNRLKR